jgi:Ala-tRNA(Pro) deacylase
VTAPITSEEQMIQFLEEQEIPFQHIEHPPVYTCEEAERLRPRTGEAENAVSTKNLFLCDKRGRRTFLVMTACEKRLDLKELASKVGVKKLRFGSEQRLEASLSVGRGAVTLLGLVNDLERQVELWVDEEIWDGAYFLCHPLVNTATLVLSKTSLERFFEITGHIINRVRM